MTETQKLREALQRIQYKAKSLADAQVIALEALALPTHAARSKARELHDQQEIDRLSTDGGDVNTSRLVMEHMMLVAQRAAESVVGSLWSKKAERRAICKAILADKNLLRKLRDVAPPVTQEKAQQTTTQAQEPRHCPACVLPDRCSVDQAEGFTCPDMQAQEPSKLTHCTCDEVSCGTAICGHAPKAQELPDERAAFEAGMSKHYGWCSKDFKSDKYGGYLDGNTETAWIAWELRAALAAKPVPDDRLTVLRDNSWGLIPFDMPTGQGDADIGWRVIEYHMDKPTERIVTFVCKDDPAAAIDAAIAAQGGGQG